MNISRKISRRSFSSGIASSSAVAGMVNYTSFSTNDIVSSSFWLLIVDCVLVDVDIGLAGKTSKRSSADGMQDKAFDVLLLCLIRHVLLVIVSN